MEQRILEELIYERVRVSVNLCQLVICEQDLDKSIQRALRTCGGTSEERESMARTYIEAAWRRVEREWKDLRDNVHNLSNQGSLRDRGDLPDLDHLDDPPFMTADD
jgi:hypothetical protein